MKSAATTAFAGPPFDKPTADIAAQSADGIVFLVHSVILADTSEVFADMLSLPKARSSSDVPGSDTIDGKPLVRLAEDSATLRIILRFCHPSVADPTLNSLDEVHRALEIADKYQIELASIEFRRRLLDFADEEPVRVYAIACLFGLRDEARIAAQKSLGHKMLLPLTRELERISLAEYHSLLDYHKRCQDVASPLARNFDWVPPGIPSRAIEPLSSSGFYQVIWTEQSQIPAYLYCKVVSQCGDGRRISVQHGTVYPPKWWFTFMEKAYSSLKECPCAAAVLDHSQLDPILELAPVQCCGPHKLINQFKHFVNFFASEVERRTSKVIITRSGQTLRDN